MYIVHKDERVDMIIEMSVTEILNLQPAPTSQQWKLKQILLIIV